MKRLCDKNGYCWPAFLTGKHFGVPGSTVQESRWLHMRCCGKILSAGSICSFCIDCHWPVLFSPRKMLADCRWLLLSLCAGPSGGCSDIWVRDICRGWDKPHMPITALPTLPTLQKHKGDGSATCPWGEELYLENIWVDLVSQREKLPEQNRPQLYLI